MENYRGLNINIQVDEDGINPREEFDNMGKMVCFHSRYNLGDDHDFSDSEELMEWLEENKETVIWLSLFLYDHSGITMNTTGFNCQWDSGQVGIIYTEIAEADQWPEDWLNEHHEGDKMKALKAVLSGEVEIYDHFLTGSVYGYQIEDENGEEIDACWGFFGDDHEKSGLMDNARNAIDCHLSWKAKEDRKKSIQTIKTAKSNFAFNRRKKPVRAL